MERQGGRQLTGGDTRKACQSNAISVGAIPAPAPDAEKIVDLQYLKAAGIE